jgi:signal transduction histidine kinase
MNWTRIVRCSIAILICFFATQEANAAEPRRVLLLHSFGRDISPFSDFAKSFQEELIAQSPDPIDLYEASIFTARFGGPEIESGLVEYLRDLFSDRRLDLLMANGDPAMRFAQRHRERLFSGIPMVITGIDQRRERNLTKNDAVVALAFELPLLIENILQVRPETTDVVLVVGNSALERYWIAQMRREFAEIAKRVNITWLNELPFDDMLERIANLSPRSAILYTMLAVDAGGISHVQSRTLEKLRAVAPVPIFGLGDWQFGQGIVGGPLVPSRPLGQQAANVALRILKGEMPGEITSPPLPFASPIYDWRELRKWGIDEARLPTNSIVQFRGPTAWEQYRWQIVLIALALAAQSFLIARLIFERRRRHRAEREAHRRMDELAHINRSAVIGEMSATLAHEINQPLAAIALSGSAGLRWLSKKTPNLDEAMAAFERIVSEGHRASEVVRTVRGMFKRGSLEKKPIAINDVIREILELLRMELERNDIIVRTNLKDPLPQVMADRTQIQQVVLNLVKNAIEAMSTVTDRPRVLRLRSEVTERGLIVTIEDTGPGIDPKKYDQVFAAFFTTKAQGMGMGLSICRSIVESHGGWLSVAPAKPCGTIFEVVLPLAYCA